MEAADAGHQIPDHDMIKTPEQIEGIPRELQDQCGSSGLCG